MANIEPKPKWMRTESRIVWIFVTVTLLTAIFGGHLVRRYGNWNLNLAEVLCLGLSWNSIIAINSLSSRNDIKGKVGFVIFHLPLILFIQNVTQRTGYPSPIVIGSIVLSTFSWIWWVRRTGTPIQQNSSPTV